MTDLERLPDRWTTRDYRVLLEIARAIDRGDRAKPDQVAEILGLTEDETNRTISDLKDAGYLDERPNIARHDGKPIGFGGNYLILTERGRRTVGLWPSGESVEALVDALRQAEDATQDPEERTLLRRAAGAVLNVPRDVMVDVMAQVITRQTGIG